MITIETIYDLYLLNIKDKVEAIDKEIKQVEREAKLLKNRLAKHEDFLGNVTDIHKLYLGQIKELPVSRCRTPIEKYTNIQVKLYYNMLSPLPYRKKEREQLEADIIPFAVFKFIITKFNDALTDEIIINRYEFKQTMLGSLKACLYEGKKKRVDWGKSHQNKKELIAKGEIPFYTKEAEEHYANGLDYKGKQWLEYHEPQSLLYLYWNVVKTKTNRLVPGITNYKFFGSKGKTGPIRKLVDRKLALTEEQLQLYKQSYE